MTSGTGIIARYRARTLQYSLHRYTRKLYLFLVQRNIVPDFSGLIQKHEVNFGGPYCKDYRDKLYIIYCQGHAELSLFSLYLSHGLLGYLHSLTLKSLIAVRPIDTLTNRSFISLFASVTFNHKQTISTMSCLLKILRTPLASFLMLHP